MKSVIFGLFLMSFSVLGQVSADYQEKNANFRISSFLDFGGRVYYACDTVEDTTRQILDELGATGADVNCSGGIDRWGGFTTEAYVRTSFESLTANPNGNTAASYQTLKLTGRTNCHLVNQIMKGLKASFDITDYKTRRCFRTNDRYTIELTVLK